jgi:hypothetical protein
MPSTVIARFSYNEEKSVLTIVFLTGKVYEYTKVPLKVYNEMKMSGSKGTYFNLHIKDHYPFKLIN